MTSLFGLYELVVLVLFCLGATAITQEQMLWWVAFVAYGAAFLIWGRRTRR